MDIKGPQNYSKNYLTSLRKMAENKSHLFLIDTHLKIQTVIDKLERTSHRLLERGSKKAPQTLRVLKGRDGLSVRVWCVWSICQVHQHQQKKETLVGQRGRKFWRGSCFAARPAECEDSPETSWKRKHTVRTAPPMMLSFLCVYA